MAFNVRIFGHRGVSQLAPQLPSSLNAVVPLRLVQPYEWSQLLATNGQTPVKSVVVAGDIATCLRIEVPDYKKIQYVFNGTATVSCERLEGVDIFQWSPGWTISIIEAGDPPMLLTDETTGAVLQDETGGQSLIP